MKIQKKKWGRGSGGGVGGGKLRVGWVMVDVIEEFKFLGNFTKKIQGGGGFGLGGGVRVDFFVKIKKKSGWGGGGQDGCERRIEVFVKIQKKNLGGGGVRGESGWGVRVDVNEELKFL